MPTDNGSATYLEAVGLALDAEMDRDPDVFLIGEDVGQFGGAFKVTKGFLDKFGPRRVVDTPIAETGFTGLAAGVRQAVARPDPAGCGQGRARGQGRQPHHLLGWGVARP